MNIEIMLKTLHYALSKMDQNIFYIIFVAVINKKYSLIQQFNLNSTQKVVSTILQTATKVVEL